MNSGKGGKADKNKVALLRVNYAFRGENGINARFVGLSEISAEEKDAGNKLLLAARKNIRRVVFCGGETTLWTPLARMIRLAHKIGLETCIQSDAARISSVEAAAALKRFGLTAIETPIAGPDAPVHGMIYGTGSFEASLAGLSFCRDAGLRINITIPLHSGNLSHLLQTVDMLLPLKPHSIRFQFHDPADFSCHDIAPSMQDAAEALRETMATLMQKGIGDLCEISCGGLPLCMLPDFGEHNADFEAAESIEVSEVADSAFASFTFSNRLHVDECAGCRHLGECPGPYVSAGDKHEVEARPRPISNSIVFVAGETLENFHVEQCQILSGEIKIPESERCILLHRGDGRASVFRSSSKDFDDDGYKKMILELGQVYLDVSGQIYHYDFEKELQKLKPHEICRACPKRAECPALHLPVAENLFRKAESLVLADIEKLRGRVLDVGCGAVRSKGVIDRLLKEHLIEYFAVEPNPPDSLKEFLHAHCIDANLAVRQIEHYEAEPESFDWIMLLCSYNHLFDIDRALKAMHGWLKPGGHLLLLENIAYGVLREAEVWEQLKAIEGAACFEHYHNHTSQEALKHVLAAGFELVSEIPITCDTANQWQAIVRKI